MAGIDLSLLPSTLDVFKSVFLNIIVTAILVAIAWFKNELFRVLNIIAIHLRYYLDSKPLVIVWVDDDSLTGKLTLKLEKILDESFRVVPLKSPEDLFRYPQNRDIVSAIILIITDVTKLSEEEGKRERTQEWLREYVSKGGGLIGGHDIIYRRTRNTILERIFGGKLIEFERMTKVRYVKNPEAEELIIFKNLPEEFELDDGEVVWGEWSDDVKVLYQTPPPKSIPLVIFREYGKGRVIWINSCDEREGFENSISKSDSNFLKLIENAVFLVSGHLHLKEKEVLILAHRGYSGKYPENTVLAFIEALCAGADGIELDVWLSKDRKAIVFHDTTLKRFNGNHTSVKELTVGELKNVHLGLGQTIPTLEEVFRLIPPDIFLDIEIKDRDAVDEVIKVIRENNMGNVLITSFNAEILRDLRKFDKNLKLGLLKTLEDIKKLAEIEEEFSKILMLSRELKIQYIGIPVEGADEVGLDKFSKFLKRLRSSGLKVLLWAHQDESFYSRHFFERLEGLYDIIITDNPERMRTFLMSEQTM